MTMLPLVDIPGNLFGLITTMKAEAFRSMGPIVSLATLLVAVTACANIVKATIDVVTGSRFQMRPFKYIKFFIVYLLVSNFQVWVLSPLDSMTNVLAEGLGSVWQQTSDASNMTGTIADRHSSLTQFMGKVEEIYDHGEVLFSANGGQTTRAFKDMVEQDVEAGTGPQVSGAGHSGKGFLGKVGDGAGTFFGRLGSELVTFAQSLYEGGKDVAQAGGALIKGIAMGDPSEWWGMISDLVMGSLASIFTLLVSVIRMLVGLCLCIFSGFYLCVIGFIGPFAFAFSLIPKMENGIGRWIARYIQVAFWYPLAQLVGSLSIIWHNVFIKAGGTGSYFPGLLGQGIDLAWDSVILLVGDICVIAMYFAIPSISKWVINSSGADGVGRKAASIGQAAGTMIGK